MKAASPRNNEVDFDSAIRLPHIKISTLTKLPRIMK